jgi:hypothetical protein
MRTDDYIYMCRKLERFTSLSFFLPLFFPDKICLSTKTSWWLFDEEEEEQNDNDGEENMEIINKPKYNHLNLSD